MTDTEVEDALLDELERPTADAIFSALQKRKGYRMVDLAAAMWRLEEQGKISYDAGGRLRLLV